MDERVDGRADETPDNKEGGQALECAFGPAYPPAVALPSVLARAADDAEVAAFVDGASSTADGAVAAAAEGRGATCSPRRGFGARIAALFGRSSHAAPSLPADSEPSPACTVLPDGTLAFASSAEVEVLPRLAGQKPDVAYALASRDVPLPPGGAAYLVALPTSADAPSPSADTPAAPVQAPPTATVVAYIDAYGRVFSVGSVQAMPPARTPDLQFVRSADASGTRTGHVEVAVSKARTARLAEYVERPQGTFALTGSRVDFGIDPSGLTMPAACAVAFLALWLFPRNEGVSLTTVSVKEVLGHLQAPNLFETVDLLIADARQSESHPLLMPPGLITYTAYNLRDAGLEHLKASDLAPVARALGPDAFDPSLLFGDLPQAPAVATARITVPAGGDLLSSIRQALEASGIAGLTFLGGTGPNGEKVPGIPSVRLIRTSAYANLLYVAFDRRQVSAEGARKLLAAESILNRLLLMAEELDRADAMQAATFEQVMELDAWVIDRIGSLAAPYLDNGEVGVERADTGSVDLDVRMSFARGCEKLRLPLRLEYAFRFNPQTGDLAVDVECPSSALMPGLVRVGEDGEGGGIAEGPARAEGPSAPFAGTSAPADAPDRATPAYRERTYAEREGLASRYALHLTALVAAVGFWAGETVSRVTVNCWHGMGAARGVDELAPLGGGLVRGPVMDEPACVATVQFDRGTFARALATPEQRERFEQDPFAFARAFRHSFALDADAHLGRVQPVLALEDDLVRPQADVRADLDGRPLTDRGAALLHAARISDLGIYENAARTQAADEVMDAFAEGDDAALAALRDVHDRTENLLVREACLRVQAGIEAGAYTASSRKALTEALGDIYGLQAGTRQAFRLLQTDPAAARRRLEGMLSELDERVVFADTDTRRYRYFDSYASRVLYGVRCPEADDGRELRLVADEYYLCHYRLSSILADSLDHAEEAIAHARRCVELAPSVAASYLRLARCYFCVFDYLSEIDAIKQMLAIAWNPSDVGLALYWLGYAFCLVDKPEVGMACYQRSADYDASLTEAAVTEAAEFLHKRGAAPKSYTPSQIKALLAQEGIDLSVVDRNVDFIVRAAGAVADAGAYGFARNLLGAAETYHRDDALPPVFESLGD